MAGLNAKITIKDTFTPMLREQSKELKRMMPEIYREFVKNTPKRSGNARMRTKTTGNQVIANYDYAGALDEGSSPKAPRGMTEPTIEFVEEKFKKIIGE
jgi:hypothetical protein